MDDPSYCVYILTDEEHSKLYTGRTGNLKRRMAQHRSGNGGVYTRRWGLVRLVYYEMVADLQASRLLERKIKTSSKQQRLKRILAMNPTWADLYDQL